MELNEQVTVQVILAACRFLMVFLMTFTVLFSPDDGNHLENVTSATISSSTSSLINLSGLYHTFPIIVYAFIFHHSIPGLSHTVSKSNKRHLKSIFQFTFLISGLGYTFVGICVGAYFGANIHQSSNLNWIEFRGGTGELVLEMDSHGNVIHSYWTNVAWWAKAISFFIVCFPALDVASAFPLNAITLGNNLMGSIDRKDNYTVEIHPYRRYMFRLIASIPPIIGAIFIRELGVITDYAGAVGFIIAFSFPALIFLSSEKKKYATNSSNKIQTMETYYHGLGSNYVCAIFVCLFGVFMAIFVLICLKNGD